MSKKIQKLLLTRESDGWFVLSRMKPKMSRILGTKRTGAYPKEGEPYWLRPLCIEMIVVLFGQQSAQMKVGTSESVWVSGGFFKSA